jgi:hypothetical protein
MPQGDQGTAKKQEPEKGLKPDRTIPGVRNKIRHFRGQQEDLTALVKSVGKPIVAKQQTRGHKRT